MTPLNRGFTLVEFILYFGLSSILLVVVASLFLTMLDARSTIAAVTSLDRDGQYIMGRLQYDVRRSTEVLAPLNPGDTAQQLQLTTPDGPISYQLVDQILMLQTDDSPMTLHVDTTVESFQVTRLGTTEGTPMLRVELTLQSPTIETTGQRTRSYVTTIGLR